MGRIILVASPVYGFDVYFCFTDFKISFTDFLLFLCPNIAGLPRSGKNIWKMKFFPGQGKVRELCGWPGKFRKDLESQGL